MPTLTQIFIHPIKSTQGLPLTRAAVGPLGLEHDRRWMLIRPDGSFITGRESPSLVRVRAVPIPGGLFLTTPGWRELQVQAPPVDAPRQEVTIWGDRCSAARVGEAADRWFSEYLG